jgi:hypothetical protein
MRYDREYRFGERRRPGPGAEWLGRGEYGETYEGPEPMFGFRDRGSAYGRGAYDWETEEEGGYGEVYGPARYGYGPYYERLKRRRRSDREIRDDVAETLFYDTWVDADRIEIDVEDGVVTLRGTLASYDEVRYATDDAWDVDGVRGVRIELGVEEEPGWGAGFARNRGVAQRHDYTVGTESGARSTGPAGLTRRSARGRDEPQASPKLPLSTESSAGTAASRGGRQPQAEPKAGRGSSRRVRVGASGAASAAASDSRGTSARGRSAGKRAGGRGSAGGAGSEPGQS